MPTLEEKTLILCSGTITYVDESNITTTGIILFPCGIAHDVHIAGSTDLQLPFKYHIYRERARVAPCCYWQDTTESTDDLDPFKPNKEPSDIPSIFEFVNIKVPASGILPKIKIKNINPDGTIEEETEIDDPDLDVVGGWAHETSPSFIVAPRTFETILTSGSTSVTTKCIKLGAESWHQGNDGTPPCNGAKTECPFYTGPRFKYINDEDLAPGQPVLAQQVQEIRQYSRDWNKFSDPQLKWEQTYDEPYIWGRDKDDEPTAIASGGDPDILESSVYTILTRVYWDLKLKDAVLNKFPSTDTGTPYEDISRRTPPSFPTIINELGETLVSDINITFPRISGGTNFIFNSFDVDTKIYIAGISAPVINLYIINKEFFPEFPDLTIENLDNEAITTLIENLNRKTKSLSYIKGFRVTTANTDRFWEIREGIDLTSQQNRIFVLAQISGQWVFDHTIVNYNFYHCDILQEGITSNLSQPATTNLVSRLTNLKTAEPIKYNLQNFSGDLAISKAYHYHVFDRSLSRFLINPDLTNQRYWKVIIDTKNLSGDGEGAGDLIWRKFDNCNRYLIEIKNPVLPTAKPAGLDKSYQPTSIKFIIREETGTSTHGPQQVTELEMQVVQDFGRSLDGKLMPVRFLIVEPKNSHDIRIPINSSIMLVNLDIFRAANSTEEGEDSLPLLMQAFSESNSSIAGGVKISQPAEDDELSTAPHGIEISDTFFLTEAVQKNNMSYMVEFKIAGTEEVIGRKWVYGVGEMSDFWARDIDIYYIWAANQQFERLLPDYNKAIRGLFSGRVYNTDLLGSFVTNVAQDTYTVFRPECGDHEITFGKPGPMFSPYDDCDPSYIKVEQLGISLLYKIIYTNGSTDERYRGPDLQFPYIYKHNILGTIFGGCYFEFSLGTFYRTAARWNGIARIRGPISNSFNSFRNSLYETFGWNKPRFGNTGREHIRIFKTMHFREFVYISSGGPRVGVGWLPLFSHLSSNSVFNSDKPRNIIDQTGPINLTTLDYSNYGDLVQLLSFGTEGQEPTIVGDSEDSTIENFNYERKKFDDVYRVKKIRDKNGNGVRWPEEGFYFTPRSNKIVWAHPEKEIDIKRNEDLIPDNVLSLNNFITGIYINKPTISGDILDRFGRDVYTSFPEDTYTIKIKDQKYNELGQVEKYASIYVNPGLELYFDRFTGEIKDTASELSALEELYTVDNVTELQIYYNTSGRPTPTIDSVFEPVTNTEESNIPAVITDIDEFINDGNLYLTDTSVKVFVDENLEGPLDETDFTWKGFIPSIDISNISPKFMPKKELIYDPEDEVFSSTNPFINFSSYPSTSWNERDGKSNTDIMNSLVEMFSSSKNIAYAFEWKNMSSLDVENGPPTSGNPDTRTGQIDPFTIDIKFKHLIEIAEVYIAYQIYSIKDNSSTDNIDPKSIPPKNDPSFSMTLFNSTTVDESVLVDKPQMELKKYNANTFGRSFTFSAIAGNDAVIPTATNNSVKIDPYPTDKIRISVGKRDTNTGFRLTKIYLKVWNLNEAITEDIVIIEPRYMITVGYQQNGNDLLQWANDPDHLTGTVSAPDISDEQEFSGISEFWRPQDYDKAEVGTRGKIRKSWANAFKTWDTDKDFNSIEPTDTIFTDPTVEDSEKRQKELIDTTLERVYTQFPLSGYLLNESNMYFLHPQDRAFIKTLNSNIIESAEATPIITKFITINSDSLGIVSATQLSPGWQDPGYYACINPETRIAACIGERGREPTIAYKQNQGVCKAPDGNYGEIFGLLDLGLLNRDSGLLGAGSSALGPIVQSQNDPNSLTNKALKNAQQFTQQQRIDKYLQEIRKRYQA